MDLIYPILAEINPLVLYGLAAVLAVVAVVCIIKKAVRVVITCVILAGILLALNPLREKALEMFGFNYNPQTQLITIKTEDGESRIPMNELVAAAKDSRTVVRLEEDFEGSELFISYYKQDGNFVSQEVPLPSFMIDSVKGIFDSMGIAMDVVDGNEYEFDHSNIQDTLRD